jgi:hypothetical protein
VEEPITNTIGMPFEIKVMTNGTFRVKDGKARPLLKGQVLDNEGMLTSANGTRKPVYDNLEMVKGLPMLMKDGDVAQLTQDLPLGNGDTISADGFYVNKSGARTHLLDGEIFDLQGRAIPVSDTVLFQDGRILVQKDGSSMEVMPGRSLMMNDGTKIMGDGTLVLRDGSIKRLTPGEIFKIEGVRTRAK